MHGTSTWLMALAVSGVALASLAGCSSDSLELPSLPKVGDLNPFKEKVVPLPGKRVAIMQAPDKIPGELADASRPINLPPAHANEAWAQPGGEASNAPGHLALNGSIKPVFRTDGGQGTTKDGRLTANPIVYGGRVFTLDTKADVRAFNSNGGSAVWRQALMPDLEKGGGFSWTLPSFSALGGTTGAGGYGGGLAADDGRLYVATGFGNVAALDPASGKKLWEKMLGVPVRAAPTAAGGMVYVVSADGRFFCLNGADGAEVWAVRGLPQQASLILSTSPAVDGGLAVVPYPSGDVVALKLTDGSAAWSESLARTRTTSQLASLSDAARPVIDAGTVYAVGHAGRMIATQIKTGERLWSLNVPGTQMPWVAGDSVFVVDTTGQLMAIAKHDGKIQWTMKLPGSGSWSGPVLAGGSLWLTSSKGQLAAVDPLTGKAGAQIDLGAPIYLPPIVAMGRMYVLNDKAELIGLN
jgi:outer membrane protein assembly factor BamB